MAVSKKGKTIYSSNSLEVKAIPVTIESKMSISEEITVESIEKISISKEQYIMLLYSYMYPQLKIPKKTEKSSCLCCGKISDERERIICFDCFKEHKESIYEQLVSMPDEIIICNGKE